MLINCVAYQNGSKLADIPVADISEYVTRPECFVWVALFEPTEEELDEMAEEFGLHPLAVEDAHKGHQRPKIEEYDDSLFVVLHTLEPASDAPDAPLTDGEVAIFVGRNYILSVRHRTQKGFDDVRARCEREPELLRHGSGFVLYALMDTVVDRYFPILDAMESELEEIEEQHLRAQRGALEHRGALRAEAEADGAEARGRPADGGHRQALRRPRAAGLRRACRSTSATSTTTCYRIHATIEGIREMLTTAIQVNLGMISLAESEVTKKLAAWAAIIAVPTMVAGIYGMNFEHMPELEWTFGYPLAIATMVAIDLYLYVRFRKARWL